MSWLLHHTLWMFSFGIISVLFVHSSLCSCSHTGKTCIFYHIVTYFNCLTMKEFCMQVQSWFCFFFNGNLGKQWDWCGFNKKQISNLECSEKRYLRSLSTEFWPSIKTWKVKELTVHFIFLKQCVAEWHVVFIMWKTRREMGKWTLFKNKQCHVVFPFNSMAPWAWCFGVLVILQQGFAAGFGVEQKPIWHWPLWSRTPVIYATTPGSAHICTEHQGHRKKELGLDFV